MSFADLAFVFFFLFTENDRARRLQVAERHGLVAIGGSDYHAWGSAEEIVPGDPGTVGPSPEAVERLRAASDRWKAALGSASVANVSGGSGAPDSG